MASAHATETELIIYPQPTASVNNETRQELAANELDSGFSLPPTDGGKHAWLLLFACFMLEGLIWGTLTTNDVRDVDSDADLD